MACRRLITLRDELTRLQDAVKNAVKASQRATAAQAEARSPLMMVTADRQAAQALSTLIELLEGQDAYARELITHPAAWLREGI